MHGSDNTMDYLVVTPEQKKKTIKEMIVFILYQKLHKKETYIFLGTPKIKTLISLL